MQVYFDGNCEESIYKRISSVYCHRKIIGNEQDKKIKSELKN